MCIKWCGIKRFSAFSLTCCIALVVLSVPSRAGILKVWGGVPNRGGGDASGNPPKELRGKEIISIAAGGDFSLAVTSDGEVFGWGVNGNLGQNGPGVLSGYVNSRMIESSTNAIQVMDPRGGIHPLGLDIKVRKIAAAGTVAMTGNTDPAPTGHCLALLDNGTVVAWGKGAENFSQRLVPSALTNPATANVVDIAAGKRLNVALQRDGTVIIWEWDFNGKFVGGKLPLPKFIKGASAIAAGGDGPGDFNLTLMATNQHVIFQGDCTDSTLTNPWPIRLIGAGVHQTYAIDFAGHLHFHNCYGPTVGPDQSGFGDVVQATGGDGVNLFLRCSGKITATGNGYDAPTPDTAKFFDKVVRNYGFTNVCGGGAQVLGLRRSDAVEGQDLCLPPPKPVLVLCASNLVTDRLCNSVLPNSKVFKWGNMIAAPSPGAQQPDPSKQPILIEDSPSSTTPGKRWIHFDGAKTFLTTFYGDRNPTYYKVPCSTVFVVMRSTQVASSGQPDVTSSIPESGSAPATHSALTAYQNLINPPMTLIGDQSYQTFNEFGLSVGHPGTNNVYLPNYRFQWNAAVTGTYTVESILGDGNAVATCCDGNPHVLAVTQQYTIPNSSISPCKGSIYIDGQNVRNYSITGAPHGIGMTCIGGGFYYAQRDDMAKFCNGDPHCTGDQIYADTIGIDTPNTFAYAANLYQGDISAVVAYQDVLDGSAIASVTSALQTNSCGLWGQ